MDNNNMQNAADTDNRSNGPRPSGKSQEWQKQIDIAAIVEHMSSEDIVELFKVLPEEVLSQVDIAEIAEHMSSEDLARLVQALPEEQLKRLDVAAIAEYMDSKSIVEFMKRLFR